MDKLRLKTYATVLPITVAAVALSGYLAFLESGAALTRLANRHLAYKAEQLRDYVNNEWEAMAGLGLTGLVEYRAAQEDSFRSYAYSLLRSGTEQVLVLDEGGAPVFRIGAEPASAAGATGSAAQRLSLPPGWFSETVFGEERVGIAFAFEPFGWTVAVTELRSLVYAEVDRILRTSLAILLAALAFAALMTAAYLRLVIGPLERLSGAVERIAATGDLSLRAPDESGDEIGALARRFNAMLERLGRQNRLLSEANLAERAARETALHREAETLRILARISDYNDEKTGAHLARIGALSALFARLLGRGEDEAELLGKAAPLHDIGKIAIPGTILNKPGKFDEAELEVMRRHATYGRELLEGSGSRYLAEGAAIAWTHHERWDGTGYPRGLAGTDIPLAGRVVGIVDVFDALTSERPYKHAWTEREALDYIAGQAGQQFDPDLVGLFLSRFAEFSAVLAGLRR